MRKASPVIISPRGRRGIPAVGKTGGAGPALCGTMSWPGRKRLVAHRVMDVKIALWERKARRYKLLPDGINGIEQ